MYTMNGHCRQTTHYFASNDVALQLRALYNAADQDRVEADLGFLFIVGRD